MAQDYGILITQPGADVVGASPNQVVLNTSNPFIKIDTQNKAGFQTITLLITTDPPEPVFPVQTRYTVLYKFKHGYTYIPSLETLFYVRTNPPGSHLTMQYFLDNGVIAAQTVDDQVGLYAVADNQWVYIICAKFNDGNGSANLLTGTNIDITTHVFVEDIGA
jgi:hypothetical protein